MYFRSQPKPLYGMLVCVGIKTSLKLLINVLYSLSNIYLSVVKSNLLRWFIQSFFGREKS